MDRAELTWRGAAAARIAVDRARARFSPPRWSRRDLHAALAPLPELAAARAAIADGRWDDAQRELTSHFAKAPRRFVNAPAMKDSLANAVRRESPQSVHDAVLRADRILSGEYDLLGFRGLRFSHPTPPALPEWQYDPVHDRRPPESFWSTVPYLDPSSGDHKIVWELNRHQHWLTLGRAYWLAGDPKYRARAIAELRSWMPSNPPLTGVNWASMLELGLRSLSWVWALQFFAHGEAPAEAGGEGPPDTDAPWLVDLLLGLDRQLGHVENNLSYYFSPNTHLLGEALALYVAGRALPELAASERRAAVGRRVLVAEIDRQIAADGGHCERSAHYHRYTLDFYLLALAVARIARDPSAADFERAADRLASAARLLADDNGRLPHIGDDDGGALVPMFGRDGDDVRGSLAIAAALLNRPELQIGATPEEVCWLAADPRPDCDARLKPRAPIDVAGDGARGFSPDGARGFSRASGALPETGYYVSRSPNGDHLVIDGGPHGYQNGGHAHADALSLTFTSRGLPLLIDPGTMSYTTDAELRDRMRSSAMHNTLTIDGRSQSLPNGPFHWTHIADARVNRWSIGCDFDYFDGAHDGYAPTEHRRRVLVRHGDLLVIADAVNGPGRHRTAAHWHFEPRWSIDVNGRHIELTAADRCVTFAVTDGIVESFTGDGATGLGWCSPVYGRLEKTTTVRVTHEGDGPFRIASVFGLDTANPVSSVEWLSDTTLRITREHSVDEVVFTDTDPSFRRTPTGHPIVNGRPSTPERTAQPPERSAKTPERSAETPERKTKDPLCAASLAS
jgi:hypothetical protein